MMTSHIHHVTVATNFLARSDRRHLVAPATSVTGNDHPCSDTVAPSVTFGYHR